MENKISDLLKKTIQWFRLSAIGLLGLGLILVYITLKNPGNIDNAFAELLWRLFFICLGFTTILRYFRDTLDKILKESKQS